MASLTAHLRDPGDHGRLPFHPQCPRCRDRLAGVMPGDAVVGRRTQAFVAAGVMALASATPTAALAAGPDREHEGLAGAGDASGDSTVDVDFDPGGESTDLPVDVGTAAPQTAPEDGAMPIEDEAATNAEEVAIDPSNAPGEPVMAPPTPTTPTTTAPKEAPDPVPASSEPRTPAPVADTPVTAPAHAESKRGGPTAAGQPHVRRLSEQPKRKPVERAPSPQPATTAPAAERVVDVPSTVNYVSTTVQATESQTTPVVRRSRAARADRVHVVQAGESLWSIARDLRGRDATVAAIAREVNRLWELNSGRIGTGDPDLLMAGTRLVLR